MKKVIEKVRQTGSIGDTKDTFGRPKTNPSNANHEEVREYFGECPGTSNS